MSNIKQFNPVHFSSESEEWSTPQDFFDFLNQKFNFTLDVASTPENAKCKNFFTKQENGLDQKWEGRIWMNPPYGRNETAKWVKKAHETVRNDPDVLVVALLPSRTDNSWFQDYCIRHDVGFLRGRLKFGGSANPAPFASMVVIFSGRNIRNISQSLCNEFYDERTA